MNHQSVSFRIIDGPSDERVVLECRRPHDQSRSPSFAREMDRELAEYIVRKCSAPDDQPPDLKRVGFGDLVAEIHRRSFASLIVVRLKDTSPEADVRIHMNAEPKQELDLLGLATLAHADVTEGVTRQLMGPPDHRREVAHG